MSGISTSKPLCCQDPCSQGRQFPSVRVGNNYATVVIMVLQQSLLLFLLLKCISDGYLVLDKTDESVRNLPFSASAGEAELPASLGLLLSMFTVQVKDQKVSLSTLTLKNTTLPFLWSCALGEQEMPMSCQLARDEIEKEEWKIGNNQSRPVVRSILGRIPKSYLST